jgi:cell volume regulation protein A
MGVMIGNWFEFDNMKTVDQICNFALLLIVFIGGFQTNITEAKPVLALASVLSVAGTLLTVVAAAAFAYFVLNFELYQALLLGAIIAPTDAASVFSVLSSKQMGLKNNLGSVLEIESGSNEPLAHILTVVLIYLAIGSQNVPLIFAQEIAVGVLSGVVLSKVGRVLINRLNVDNDGVYGVLLCGVAFLIFGLAAQFGGSGFLAVYIGGIILGNGKLVYKRFLTRLFSAISMLMQITLFIILGILCVPSSVVAIIGSGLLFALFLLFIARPLITLAIMKPFGRPLNEIALVSWAGFRGASSIVFSTHLLTVGLPYAEYVFSMVFFVCMLSVIVQGPFVAAIARRLGLIDE